MYIQPTLIFWGRPPYITLSSISTFKPRYNKQVSLYFIIFRIEKKIILLIGGGGGIGGGMQGSGGGFGGQVQGDDCR